ncbi:hypothetical protein A2U01_0072699 [Trifolium medium]|uniref:Uncharacterized protein n=1 Tax=Trifolium medium TaxID=97028 RepID=A0A392STU4_9FABA|nr:hypothetical protein [Trifolium medium]
MRLLVLGDDEGLNEDGEIISLEAEGSEEVEEEVEAECKWS